MKIELGKTYIDQAGTIIGPMIMVDKPELTEFPFTAKGFKSEYDYYMPAERWNEDGVGIFIPELIEEYKPLIIEEGKKYLNGFVNVVGPMSKSSRDWLDDNGNVSKFQCPDAWNYSETGFFIYGEKGDLEHLVSEYVQQKVVPSPSWAESRIYIQAEPLDGPTVVYNNDPESPVEKVVVNRLKAGNYGRLKLSTDGYHAINIGVIDGGRTWSNEDLKGAIETLTLILDSRT